MYQHKKSERSYRNNWVRVYFRVHRKRGRKSEEIIEELAERIHRSPETVKDYVYRDSLLELDKGTGTKRRRLFKID